MKALSDSVAHTPGAKSIPSIPRQRLKVTIRIEGDPPSQILKVIANQPVVISRVDYMLSSEATIAGEDVSREGVALEIPVNDSLLMKLWNTPRLDRNHYDHSGPAKLGVTIAADGQDSQQFVLPVQMENTFLNSTAHRKLVGSKTFHESGR